jgi:hypothetical protein
MDDDGLSNAAYYRNREVAERTLAQDAPAKDIQRIHLQLARRYAELAEEFEARGRAGPSRDASPPA